MADDRERFQVAPRKVAPQKQSLQCDSFSKDQILRARRSAWKVPAEHREAYLGWLENHSKEDPTFKDILILSRCPEDVQAEAITELQTGKADTLMEAIRNVKRRRIVEEEAVIPEGQYRCLIVDPPWPLRDANTPMVPLEDRSPADHLDYTPMTIEQIKAFPIPELSHDECHCYLWTTQRFLPVALDILTHWGFRYSFVMVWRKSGGMQPFGLPQFNCEFALFGNKGALPFIDTTDFRTCFDGKRREHSRKPAEFYELLQRVSPGPRCDVFSREAVDGFKQGGKQTATFNG